MNTKLNTILTRCFTECLNNNMCREKNISYLDITVCKNKKKSSLFTARRYYYCEVYEESTSWC